MVMHSADVAILMPSLDGRYDRFGVRYAGLARELADLSVDAIFAESHTSYQAETKSFANPFDVEHRTLAESATAPVVRDLTMALDAKPLYDSNSGIKLVHHPDTNRFLASKRNLFERLPAIHPATRLVTASNNIADHLSEIPGEKVVIKPGQGMASKGIHVVTKREAEQLNLSDGEYLLQAFIDTSAGIPSLGIEGVHNVRTLSIGNVAIGSIARIGGTGHDMLKEDIWGAFIGNDDLPEAIHSIVDQVHGVMRDLPGNGENIIAIDTMRGVGPDGEQIDVLCEVNRRPMRVSEWDIREGGYQDANAIRQLGQLWDAREAALLQRQLG